jgi:hypothetical protein
MAHWKIPAIPTIGIVLMTIGIIIMGVHFLLPGHFYSFVNWRYPGFGLMMAGVVLTLVGASGSAGT